MFYVIIDKFPRIVIERWKEITTNLTELSSEWIILWEDESPCFFEISSICFHSVLSIHDYLRDTTINDENTIIYLRTNEKYASVWFHMLEQMNIEWFFTNFPNMLDEIYKIEIMKNYKILYIPFAPIEKSNHFIMALFNLIHSGFINRKVQPEQQELFRSLQGITPRQGQLYWYEPQFSLVEVLNLISLHKNITLETLTNYLLSKECQLQSHTNIILNQSIQLLKNYNQDFSYSLDYQQHESPSFFVWKASVLKSFLANRSSTPNENLLHELMNNPEYNIGLVDLSKWKNVQIKWFQSRGIPAQTIDYLSKIESFFKPSRNLNNSIYRDYHQFIWFPFQEEYQHVFNTNVNEYIQSTNQILRHRYLIQNYFIESKCQIGQEQKMCVFARPSRPVKVLCRSNSS